MQKIVFMGSPDYAVVILRALLAEFELVGVFTQADKRANRGKMSPSKVKEFLSSEEFKALNLKAPPLFTPSSLKDEAVVSEIQNLEPDFIVVAAYGKLLPKSVLDIAPCINLHASILPKYRGASPIQSAILNGDTQSGVTAMLMNEGLDTGDILKSTEISIKAKRADEVFNEFSSLAAKLCVETLKEFKHLKPLKQEDSKASYCKKIKKEDGLIDIRSQSAREIYQKFLAFYPWPGVFLENGLKFIDLELIDETSNLNAGQISNISANAFNLACKTGTLKIKALQEAGKKVLRAGDFINGKRLKNEDYLC